MLTPTHDLYPSNALYPDDDEVPGGSLVQLRDPLIDVRRDDDEMLLMIAHFVRML